MTCPSVGGRWGKIGELRLEQRTFASFACRCQECVHAVPTPNNTRVAALHNTLVATHIAARTATFPTRSFTRSGASGDRVLLVLLLPEKRADGLAISAEELKSMRARCLRHKTRGRTPAESVQSAPPRLLLPRRGKDAARARHRLSVNSRSPRPRHGSSKYASRKRAAILRRRRNCISHLASCMPCRIF